MRNAMAPGPLPADPFADNVKARNMQAFSEIKSAMRSLNPTRFVQALRQVHNFVARTEAFYPEALPDYVEMLEVSLREMPLQ